MGSRTATSIADVYALNSTVYGGGAHAAIVASYISPRQEFWDCQKIKHTVNEKFIASKIPIASNLRSKLDKPVGFGRGLTDETYMEWIMHKSPKLFLVLCDIGIPEQIFPVVDESCDDNDLPLPFEAIERLQLSPPPGNASLNRSFFKKQFKYVIREIREGHHVDYIDQESVPIIQEETRNSVVMYNNVDKIYLPGEKNSVFARKRVKLSTTFKRNHGLSIQDFMTEVRAMRTVNHPHIVSLFGSYTFEDGGYLLLTPVCDLTLDTFIQFPPFTWKSLTKDERRRQLLNWIHCLSNALAYLHHQGIIHGDITPSSIVVNGEGNNILFANIGNSKRLDPLSYLNNKESYDYSAPEYWPDVAKSPLSPVTPGSAKSGFFSFRRPSATRSDVSSGPPTSPTSSDAASVFSTSTNITEFDGHEGLRPPSAVPDQERADVFSLGCVIMDIVNCICKRKSGAFVSHRSGNNQKKLLPFGSMHPDSSFHANIDQVHSWANQLRQDCIKKDKDDLAVRKMIALTQEILITDIPMRPDSRELAAKLHSIVSKDRPSESTHCGLEYENVNANADHLRVWEPAPVSTYEHPCYAEARKVSFLETSRDIGLLDNMTDSMANMSVRPRNGAGGSISSDRSSSGGSVHSNASKSTSSHRSWRERKNGNKENEKKKEDEEKKKKRKELQRYADPENKQLVGLWGSQKTGGWAY